MLYFLAVSLKLCWISMSGGRQAKKLSQKTQNRLIVDIFLLAGLYRLVQGKWSTAQMWARYINKNNPLLDASYVDAVMLHHAVYKKRK